MNIEQLQTFECSLCDDGIMILYTIATVSTPHFIKLLQNLK